MSDAQGPTPEPLNDQVVRHLRDRIGAWPEHPPGGEINSMLRMMSRWRQMLVLAAYQQRHGRVIWSGPFQGMDFVATATEGALLPRLLGTYEAALHPHLHAFADEALDLVVDVGCAEGYYAVGLARLMPKVQVRAFDIDEGARAACAELAARNGVADRVTVGGEFQPRDFEQFAGARVLVIVDAEGAEVDILQPDLSPALATFNLIVETHDVYRPGALATLVERFSPTHEIVRVLQSYAAFTPPPWFAELSHLDQLLAVWEWRQRPTPWLVMRPKSA